MTYLQRINYLPNKDALSPREIEQLDRHFDAYGAEVVVNGEPVRWGEIDEVEVAVAARSRGPAGWLVKHMVMGGDKYHVAFYAGRSEFVLTNISLNMVRYVVLTAAYYAPGPLRYTGPEDIAPLTEI